MTRVAIMPDTNVFLHYQTIDQIDWRGLLTAESVSIIVPQVIIRELNAAKDGHPSPKIRKRAAASLRRLDELAEKGFEVELRANVNLCFETSEPALDFAVNQLNPQSQDDVLLASFIALRGAHLDERVVLATADLGLKLKARYRNIEILSLPETLKLPDDPDPNEQRVRELETQLRELSVTLPSLVVSFADHEDYRRFSVARLEELTSDEMDFEMAQVMAISPKLSVSTGEPSDQRPNEDDTYARISREIRSVAHVFDQPSPDEIVAYNQRLDEFYKEYRQYVASRWEYQNTAARTILLELLLRNDGNWPAEDVDVMLHFPDGFELRKRENRICAPGRPETPSRPQGGSDWLRGFQQNHLMLHPSVFLPTRLPPPGNVSGPTIRRSTSYDVEFNVRKLKHGFSEKLDLLYLTFDSYDMAVSFEINFRINAGNMPKESFGHLHVVIEKAEKPALPSEFEDDAEEQEAGDTTDDG